MSSQGAGSQEKGAGRREQGPEIGSEDRGETEDGNREHGAMSKRKEQGKEQGADSGNQEQPEAARSSQHEPGAVVTLH